MSTSFFGGHVDTFIQPASPMRRTRRRHSAEFKAQISAACRQPGVSIAAVALANGLNANLVRRWVAEHEVELHGHAVSATISWPLSAADACASWLRTMLR